jgi:hypothetical protein
MVIWLFRHLAFWVSGQPCSRDIRFSMMAKEQNLRTANMAIGTWPYYCYLAFWFSGFTDICLTAFLVFWFSRQQHNKPHVIHQE